MKRHLKLELFDNPWRDRDHPITAEGGSGVQKVYKFDNNYGASVVRFKLNDRFSVRPSFRNGYGSYTSNEEQWELAVIAFTPDDDWQITYKTSVSGDVEGHLTETEVEALLQKIKKLEKRDENKL